jgi:hypothetical protein
MRRLCGWVAAMILVPAVFAAAARAQQPASPGGGTAGDAGDVAPSTVQLVVVGGGSELAPLVDALRDRLGRVGVVVVAHAAASPAEAAGVARGSAAVRVQVDLRAAGETVLVTEGRLQGTTQRSLRRDPSPGIAREELAQAVQSAVESQLFPDAEARARAAAAQSASPPAAASSEQLAGPPPGAASVPAPAPAPVLVREAPSASPSSSPFGVDVSTLAGGGWLASTTGALVTLGGEVTVASRRGLRPSLSISARAVLPFDATADSVSAHASAFEARALAGLELAHGSWFALVAGTGGGTEVVWTDPRSAVLAPSVLGSASTRLDPILSAFAAAHVSLVPSVALTVMMLGDWDPVPVRYVVEQGSNRDAVLAPWNVRPTVLAGFTFTALGPPAFAARTQ